MSDFFEVRPGNLMELNYLMQCAIGESEDLENGDVDHSDMAELRNIMMEIPSKNFDLSMDSIKELSLILMEVSKKD